MQIPYRKQLSAVVNVQGVLPWWLVTDVILGGFNVSADIICTYIRYIFPIIKRKSRRSFKNSGAGTTNRIFRNLLIAFRGAGIEPPHPLRYLRGLSNPPIPLESIKRFYKYLARTLNFKYRKREFLFITANRGFLQYFRSLIL